jgi:hypothetical protein
MRQNLYVLFAAGIALACVSSKTQEKIININKISSKKFKKKLHEGLYFTNGAFFSIQKEIKSYLFDMTIFKSIRVIKEF